MYRLGSLVELLEQRLSVLEERYLVLLNRVEELQRIANATVAANKQSQPSAPSPATATTTASSPLLATAFSSPSPVAATASSPPNRVSFGMTELPATDARNDMINLLADNNESNDEKVIQAISDLIGDEEDGDIF